MSGLTEGATMRRINALCRTTRAALHIPTNHRFQVIMEIPGAGVELKDMEGRIKYATWAAWNDGEIWRLL